jgi:amino acid transporter
MLLTFSALSPVVSFYVAGDSVLRMAGTGAGLAYVLGALASAVLALLYAEIGAAFPGAGGVYPSLAALLGRALSFPYIVLMAPIAFAGTAYVALGFADYVAVFAPEAPRPLVAMAAIVCAAAIGLLHLKASSLITGVFLAVELGALVVFCVVAGAHPVRSAAGAALHPVMLEGGRLVGVSAPGLALAFVASLWATAGSNWALYFAEEMHEARARIGRVIALTGLAASVLVATPMVLAVMAAPDLKRVLAAPSPLAELLAETGGPLVARIVAAGVIVANFNCIVVSIMAYARYLFSTARDGVWPGGLSTFLAKVSQKSGTPARATIAIALVAAAATLLGERTLIVFLSGNVSDYVLVSLAVIIGRRKGLTGGTFKSPVFPLVPVFGLLVAAASMVADWLDPEAGRPSLLLLSGLFGAACVYFLVRLREASKGWGGGMAEDAPHEEPPPKV